MEGLPLPELIIEVISEMGTPDASVVEALGSIRIWFPELIVIAPLPLVIEDPAINSVWDQLFRISDKEA
jgi:hypothetical protein